MCFLDRLGLLELADRPPDFRAFIWPAIESVLRCGRVNMILPQNRFSGLFEGGEEGVKSRRERERERECVYV